MTTRPNRTARRRLVAAAVPLALAAAALAAPTAANAEPAPSSGTTTRSSDSTFSAPGLPGTAETITLITGDRVTLSPAGTGNRYGVDVVPARRADGRIREVNVSNTAFVNDGGSGSDSVYALPADASALIAGGRVGEKLFDVQYLAAHGYADGAKVHLPVVATFTGHPSANTVNARADALPASTLIASFPKDAAAELSVDLRRASDFWAAVTTDTDPTASTSKLSPATTLANGIASLSLPGHVSRTTSDLAPADEAGPLYTVTETIEARDGSEVCGHLPGQLDFKVMICADYHIYDRATGFDFLYALDGTGNGKYYGPTHAFCVQSTSPCKTMRLEFSVPAGIYMSSLNAEFEINDQLQSIRLVNPEFSVTGDTSISFDLNDAQQVTIDTPHPTEPRQMVYSLFRAAPGSTPLWTITFSSFTNHWLLPTRQVTVGTFHYTTAWTLSKPQLTMTVTTPKILTLHPFYPLGAAGDSAGPGGARFSGSRTLPLVNAGYGRDEDFTGLDVRGKLALIQVLPTRCSAEQSQLDNALHAGAAGVIFDPINPNDTTNGQCEVPLTAVVGVKNPGIPWVSIPPAEARTLLDLLGDNAVSVTVADSGPTPYLYSLKFYERGRIPDSLRYTVTKSQLTSMDSNYRSQEPQKDATTTVGAWAPDETKVGLSAHGASTWVRSRQI